MKRIIIFLVLLANLFSISIIGQANISSSCTAFTNVDFNGFNGMASDDCSSATCYIDPLREANLVLSQSGCSFIDPDGNPGADIIYSMSINHNNYPVTSLLTYEVPYGFEYKLEGTSAGANCEAEINYSFSQSDNIQTNNIQLFGSSFLSENLNNNYIMKLPRLLHGVHFMFSAFIQTSSIVDDIAFELDFLNQLQIMVPSQFYLDNGLIGPTTVNLNTTTGSMNIQVQERCAEDIILEEGTDLGSYTYSAANILYVDTEVKNSTNVVFSAGNSINFEPGYSVELGSSMTTQVYTGCTN